MLKWYVIELKGGGLMAIMLAGSPDPEQNHISLTAADDSGRRNTIYAGNYSLLADYESEAEAMAFIAGLELGHERREEVRESLTSRLERVLGVIEAGGQGR
jgi:hypothetical protein